MELCVQKATPLSQDNGRCIISTAPSVPTHDPTKVLEDTEQPSLSAQTTAEASQDSDRVFDSSSIPSNTASTAASSLSQPYLTSLQEKSTLDLSNSLRSQDHVVIDIDSIQVISTQLPAKEPTLIPKLAKGSKTQANVENQDQDDGIGAEPQSRQPFEASKTSRMVACTDSYVAHQHDLAILSGNKSDSQPDRVQVSPETTASTSQLAGAQAEPAHFPKLTQVSKGKHPLFRYKQKAYISPTMPMSQDILDRWELRIKLRLEDAICQTMHDMNATDGSLSIDCFMAGHTESNLKPTIVIGCSTDRLRRKLLKQIKRFVWIPENGFECMVIEGLTPMLAASSTSVTSSALASASSTSQHSDGGLSGGAIAGISIGALVFGLSLMCCGCWWYRKRRMMRALAVESLNHQLQRQGLDKYDLDGMVRGDLQPYGAELNLDLASELELRQETNELTEMSQNNVPTESKGKLASLPPRIQETQKMKAANSGSAHSVHTKAPDAKRSIKLHNIGITQKYATTLCASLLRTLTPEMKPRVSTLGGLILVDDKVYGLSVAHSPTFDGLANDDSENPCNSVVEDEGDDYDDVGSDETLFVEFQPGVTTDCEYRPASHTQNKDRNRTSPLSRRDGDENGMITSKNRMDWAIFAVDDPALNLPNLINDRRPASNTVDSVCPERNMTAGEVIVAAGLSDNQFGSMSQCSASLWYQKTFMTVRQVTLEKPLRPGDSGSWVTRGSQVCGHVVAVKDALSWAYIAPMQMLLDDIKTQFRASEAGILPGTPNAINDAIELSKLSMAMAYFQSFE